MDVTVADVSAAGTTLIQTFGPTRSISGGTAADDAAPSSIAGVTLRTLIDDQLRVGDVTVESMGAAAAEPEARQIVEALTAEVEVLTSPLPAEPVGTGAVWQVTSRSSFLGVSIRVIQEVRLLELTADVAVADFAVQMTIEPGPIPAGGAAMTVERGEMLGSGRMTIDLTRPVAFGEQRIDGGVTLLVGADEATAERVESVISQRSTTTVR